MRDPRRTREWARVRSAAIATKDHVCYLCGRPIDKLSGTEPLSLQVDHVIPVSRGGPVFDLDNLMLTHKICNQIKGSKFLGEKVETESTLAVDSMMEFEDDYLDWMEE